MARPTNRERIVKLIRSTGKAYRVKDKDGFEWLVQGLHPFQIMAALGDSCGKEMWRMLESKELLLVPWPEYGSDSAGRHSVRSVSWANTSLAVALPHDGGAW